MIENNQAIVKANLTISQFQVIHCAAGEPGLDEVFKVIAPITKTAAQRKGQIHFVEQFKAQHQALEQSPGIPKLNLMISRCPQLAT